MLKTLKIGGIKFTFGNFYEFLTIYKDVFLCQDYKFTTTNNTPFILDCGSHIGISVLYFKKRYPNSEIFVFEPNPNTFTLLKKNIRQNDCKSVTLFNKAISDRNGKIDFYIKKDPKEPSWSDTADLSIRYEPDKYRKIKVRSVKLSQYLNKRIDFLKLDIEGLETRVLEEASDKIKNVREMVIEFHHSEKGKDNNLVEILKMLRKNSFQYKLWVSERMFGKKEISKKELQNNIFNLVLIHAKQK